MQPRPVIDACFQCFEFHANYVSILMDWKEFVSKYWGDAGFKTLIDKAEQQISGEAVPEYRRDTCESFQETNNGVKQIQLILTERELANAARVDYVPRDMVKDPHVDLPKQGPGADGGTEPGYLFRWPLLPWRFREEVCLVGERKYNIVMDPSHHVWESKSSEVMARLKDTRMKSDGSKVALAHNHGEMPDLSDWVHRCSGGRVSLNFGSDGLGRPQLNVEE